MSLLLYLAAAVLVVVVIDRRVTRISRGAALGLLLLPMVFTGRALITGSVYAPLDLAYQFEPLAALREQYGIGLPRNVVLTDLITQMIPWRKAVQWSWAQGQWPLWNPFILTGDVLAATAQPAAYSPVTLLACLLPVAHGLTFSAAFTFFMAGLGAFLLVRELQCREPVALFGAAAWMYSTGVAFFVLWPLGHSWGLLPLVLFGVRRVVRQPSLRSSAVLTLAFVLLLLAGHPETALHVVTIAALFALFEWSAGVLTGAPGRGGGEPRVWTTALILLACGILALSICAVYLLPLVEAAPQTSEHEFRTAVWASRPRGVDPQQSFARLATDFLPFLHLRKWTLPRAAAIPADTAAVGSLVLALAVYGLWRVRSRAVAFFAFILLFGLVARAEPRWFESILQMLPLFDVALNARFVFASAFALVVLACLGLESAAAGGSWRGAAVTSGVVLVVLAIGTWLAARLITGPQLPWAQFKVMAELAILGAAVMVMAVRPATVRVLPLLIGLLLLQRFAEEGRAYPTIPGEAAYPPIPLLEPLRNVSGPFRIAGVGDFFPPGTSTLYELEDVRGYQALTLLRHAETYDLWSVRQPVWFNRVDDLTRPFLSFLNVRYAIAPQSMPVPPDWKRIATQPGSQLLENGNVIPRAFIPRKVRLGTPPREEIAEMRGETDFTERAWILASMEPHERDNGQGQVMVERRGADYHLDVEMAGDGWVVVSESAWKGWRAYIDGRRVQMQVANHAFLGVYVPAGRHEVRLTYRPQSFVAGRTISMATLAAIVIGLAIRRFRKSPLPAGEGGLS